MKRVIKEFFLLMIVFLIIPGALVAEKTNKQVMKTIENYIAVFDFEVTTGDKGISRPLTESVRREIVLSGQYDVIDRGNMNKILGEQKFQLSGCVAQECIVDAGQLLGVGKIISGTVSIVGKTYYLTLSLISVKTGKIENIAEDTCRCEVDELLGSTKRLAKKLLGEKVEQPLTTVLKPATIAESKAKVETEERTRVETEAKAKADAIAKANAEAEEAAREKARAEAIAKAKAEEIERAKAEQAAKARAEAEEAVREKARAEAIAKAKAEEIERAKAAQEAKVKAETEAKAKAEESERAITEQIAREKAKADAEARAKSEEIERLKAELAKARADAELRAKYEEAERIKSGQIGKAEVKKQEFQKVTSAVDQEAVKTKIIDSGDRFEKRASGVVRDKKSGLEWYAGPDENTSQVDANRWISGINVDGGGWRMPTIGELKGLYQRGTGSRNMTPLFENTGWFVWSGDIGVGPGGGDNKAWVLDFGDNREILDRRDSSNFKRGFAVRSTPKTLTSAIDSAMVSNNVIASDGRFEKLASGVVHDTQSGLDWYAGPDKNTEWRDAMAWITSLKVDGGGWRMPTISQLKSLYHKGVGPRNITSLLETTGWWIWSGESTRPWDVWSLNLDDGTELADRRENSNFKRVFAVRSRK